jgi:hypothetical protein
LIFELFVFFAVKTNEFIGHPAARQVAGAGRRVYSLAYFGILSNIRHSTKKE